MAVGSRLNQDYDPVTGLGALGERQQDGSSAPGPQTRQAEHYIDRAHDASPFSRNWISGGKTRRVASSAMAATAASVSEPDT